MKKSFIIFIVLLIFSGTIFYFGWVQLKIPAGQYGVLVSKTGGINPQTIVPGSLRWQWECLIPTNAKILCFDLVPIIHTNTVSDTLPSGSVYSKMIEGSPDFSWQFTCETTARIIPETLPTLVEYQSIQDQEALEQWTQKKLSDQAKILVGRTVKRAIETATIEGAAQIQVDFLAQEIIKEMQATEDGLEIISVSVIPNRFPDLDLYHSAAKTYETYQNERRVLWTKTATDSAADSVSDYLSFERFSRWGELLTRYPILIDFFTSAGAENHPLKK